MLETLLPITSKKIWIQKFIHLKMVMYLITIETQIPMISIHYFDWIVTITVESQFSIFFKKKSYSGKMGSETSQY